ncbi:unnamed protein product [Soboliphyme baturini]|uniref:Secreted RxLR effector peptide protein n=1 Tax=Soboliphyme baturini TaxID=241478 RepID=A0A183IM05_9BILA|nr:unnamed protein product [Soboliphyme baturini]
MFYVRWFDAVIILHILTAANNSKGDGLAVGSSNGRRMVIRSYKLDPLSKAPPATVWDDPTMKLFSQRKKQNAQNREEWRIVDFLCDAAAEKNKLDGRTERLQINVK